MKEIRKIKTDEADISLSTYADRLIGFELMCSRSQTFIEISLGKEEAGSLAQALIDAIIEVD